ncbi:MAG: MaoC family dehydratase [Hyphomicrobiaceae bacterium]
MSNWFEDLQVGHTMELGNHTFTAEAIKAFAARYDPQPFHIDEVAAENSLFGRLCASGWQTVATYMKLSVRARQAREAEARARGEDIAQWGPSPGFRNLKWPRPVFVGDTINYRQGIVDLTSFGKRTDRGVMITRGEGFNQNGELVFEITGQILVPRRHPLPATP